ncbi:YybH family protein [Streptomyces bullii]|uniref:YybH family protein n=1 Tax=Streptomyces bullii TaxID=349910 RepID=A0ABW0UXU2_9ACTN
MNLDTDSAPDHGSTVALTSDAAQHPGVFAAAFNSGSPLALARVYDDQAVFVPRPGTCVSGTELTAANSAFQSLGLPIRVHPRHTYVAGDIALLVVDWVIDGRRPDGEHVHLEGTATDVARRGADGLWRYVIDNPFGTSAP